MDTRNVFYCLTRGLSFAGEGRLTEVWDGEVETGSLIAEYYYDPFGEGCGRMWEAQRHTSCTRMKGWQGSMTKPELRSRRTAINPVQPGQLIHCS